AIGAARRTQLSSELRRIGAPAPVMTFGAHPLAVFLSAGVSPTNPITPGLNANAGSGCHRRAPAHPAQCRRVRTADVPDTTGPPAGLRRLSVDERSAARLRL